jgi:hypothetical protein
MDQIRQQVRRNGEDDAELEAPGELIASRLRHFRNARRLLENLLRLLDDARADGGHGDPRLAALEEPRPELLLQLLDRHRQRRLAHEALLGSAAEALFLRDGDDVAQFGQRHGRRQPCFICATREIGRMQTRSRDA